MNDEQMTMAIEQGTAAMIKAFTPADLASFYASHVDAEITLTQIDRVCARYVMRDVTAEDAMQQIVAIISKWTDPGAVEVTP